MKAARYARVSSAKQADNTSIPNQLDRTAAYIEAQGWELVATFTEPGESGENLDRPALTAVRQMARQGEFDVLVVNTLDRLTRDLDDLFLLRREFQAVGVRTWAVHDGLDICTADVDDLLQVLFRGYFGHRERETIRRRTLEGKERHVKAGKFSGGLPPYGYRVSDDKRLEIDEETAHVVGMIFSWAADGMSGRAIAERLNALEIPSPWAHRGIKGKRRDGVRQIPLWKPATIRNIIKSETYAGHWVYGKRGDSIPQVVVEVPAIVDRVTWEKAQEMARMNRRYTRPPKHRYLLRGLIRCADCGASYCGLAPRRKTGFHSYRCIGRYRWEHLRDDRKCNSLTINGPELETAIWSDIEEFVRQPHLVAEELNRHRVPVGEDLTARLVYVDQQIAEREAELDRCLGLYVRGTISVVHLDAKVQEIETSLAALQAYRGGLVEEQRRVDLWEREMLGVIEALTLLQGRLDAGLEFDDRRAIVEKLVKGVVIETQTDDAGELYSVAHVTYRFEQPKDNVPLPAELVPLFSERWRHIDKQVCSCYHSAHCGLERRDEGQRCAVSIGMVIRYE